jgi:hypothetical protein
MTTSASNGGAGGSIVVGPPALTWRPSLGSVMPCGPAWRGDRLASRRVTDAHSSVPAHLDRDSSGQDTERMEHMRPRIGSILLGALFALLCAADAWQLGQAARGRHPDPPSLLVTHGIAGVLAGLAALGIVRDRRWARSARSCGSGPPSSAPSRVRSRGTCAAAHRRSASGNALSGCRKPPG